MKWRVIEKRAKRREALYHRFMARYFTVENARKYFDSLVESKAVLDTYRYERSGRELFRTYLHLQITKMHGLSLAGIRNRSGRIYSYKYGEIFCDHGYRYIDGEWYQHIDGQDKRDNFIKKQGDCETEINKLMHTEYIQIPASFEMKDDRYGPNINEKFYLARRNKENVRLSNTLRSLQKLATDACALSREVRSRIRKNAKGRRQLIAICPPELLADYQQNGDFDFVKFTGVK